MRCKVEEVIRSFVSFDRSVWDEYLIDFEVAYSSSANATTMFTPLYFGYWTSRVTVFMDFTSSPVPAAKEFLYSVQKTTAEAQKSIKKTNYLTFEYANKKRLPIECKAAD